MTITQLTSAPLVAVVGATGNQGGSVIKALAESDKPYRIRAFTRDPTKPAALELIKLGVEVVLVSFVVENKDYVYKTFVGADVAFLVTNFWEHLNMKKEIEEGKLLIDAAKAGGVSRIVWSGLQSINADSGGKYTHVYHFDGKALVSAYGRQSGVPFVDLQAGLYGTNWLTPPFAPIKQEDGSFALTLPISPETVVPFIDTVHDYGLFVRRLLEMTVFPDGSEFLAYSENIALGDMVLQLSHVTGKKIVFKPNSVEQLKQYMTALGGPPYAVLARADILQFYGEFGWKGTPRPEGVGRSPRTWAEFVKATDWSKVFA
ncbi:NAD(P)-binding protein [Mycena epipterygia]|nr:NAD(P)-binding protein [Mycena epipterygia]